MRSILYYIMIWISIPGVLVAQEISLNEEASVLSYEEFIGMVKAHHPLMKQADLRLTEGEATLLKARGGFDPKIEVDYQRKEFKDTQYWEILNGTFKIPTWYGVEFKANFEENTGTYLNPERTVPQDGLYSAGVSIDLARGFLINERMANLRKAKFFMEQTQAERELLLNNLIYEATNAYLDWVEAYNETQIYDQFLTNAQQRFQGIKRSVEAGVLPAIDSVEARITYQNRQLNLEAARLKQQKAVLSASNFLWLNEVPVEIKEGITPVTPDYNVLTASLVLESITNLDLVLEAHPKLRSLDAKIGGLEVDRSFKRNKLLPKLTVDYNFLSETPDQLDSFNTADYKGGISFQFPLFLRKERGEAKLANVKLQDANLDRMSTSLALQNKIKASQQEITSMTTQQGLINAIVIDYQQLVNAEERKFELGESSLFLINSREQKLIEASLKENTINVKVLKSVTSLYNAAGLSI